MKNLITACLMIINLSLFAQEKVVVTQQKSSPQASSPRTAATSARTENKAVEPLTYDVNDKFMGRKNEFLNMIIVPELPSDFPIYDKQWGVKEYNAVIDAYFMTHKDILKERVKQKIQYQIDKQQTK